MKKLFGILLLSVIATLGFSSSGQAQTPSEEDPELIDVIDLETLDCRTLLKSEGEDRSNIMIFMHGYMSGKNAETVVDAPALISISDQVLEACIDSPESPVMDVFDEYR